MTTYTVTLTAAENMALGAVAVSPQEWVDNAVHNRCRVAIDEIIQVVVAKCLESQQPIPNSKDLMVEMAFAQGWVKTAAQRQADSDAEMALRITELNAQA